MSFVHPGPIQAPPNTQTQQTVGPGPALVPGPQAAPPPNVGQILKTISHYNYGQESNPGQASSIAKNLANEIMNMSPKDAQKVLKQIAGTTLGSDVQGIISPTSAPTATLPQFNMGSMFTQAIAPFLQSQEQMGNQEVGELAKSAEGALSNASPALKQAYSVGIPALQGALTNQNIADTTAAATAPEWDNMLNQVNQMVQNYKLAQAAAQAEPYWAATTGQGVAPSTGAAQQANNFVTQMQQQILNQQAQNQG